MLKPTCLRRLALATVSLTLVATCSSLKVYRIRKLEFPNKSGRLANGMRVVIQPDPSVPYAVAVMRYEVGAGFDPPGRKGLAHLVEHLAFRLGDELVDLEKATPDAAAPQAEDGKRGDGEKESSKVRVLKYIVTENAYTTLDETVYWKRVVPLHLGDVLDDFAAQMGDFSGKISEDIFETERKVVRNERRSSYEGQPLDRAVLDLYERIYPEGHPYRGQAVIGSHETIAAIELADVAAFLDEHYHPGNATLSIVGPVDAEETLQMVIKKFGDKPKRPESTPVVPDWQPTARRETVIVPKAKQTLVTVAWPLGPEFSDEVEAMRILRDRGWFWWRLVSNRDIAYWVTSGVWEQRLGSLFVVRALLKSHGDVDSAVSKILEIADHINGTIGVESFGESRRRHIYAKVYESEGPSDRAEAMAKYFWKFGKPMGWVEELDRWHDLDLSYVKRVGARLLEDDRAFVMVHTPITDDAEVEPTDAAEGASYSKKEAEAAGEGDLGHDERDLPPAIYDFEQPFDDFRGWTRNAVTRWDAAEETTLANGIRCRIVRTGSLPITFVQTNFIGGELAEPEDKHGVAKLMLSTMSLAGRADRSRRYRMGMHGWWDVSDERITYGRKFLSYYLDEALGMLAKQLSSPKHTRKNIAINRDYYLQTLEKAGLDVDWIVFRALWKARGLAEVSPVMTIESVESVSLFDVWDYHDQIVYPENMVIGVASNLPVATVRRALEEQLGGWSAAGAPAKEWSKLAPPAERVPKSNGDVVLVDVDASQTKLEITFDGPGWHDWKSHLLMSGVATLLGKKIERLRRAMGVTYGASSSTWALRNFGALRLSTKVETAAAERALEQLVAVIEAFRKEPITEDQLQRVKRGLMQNYANSGDEARAIATSMATQLIHGLPKDHYLQAVDWVAGLTLADLQEMVDRLLGQKGTLVIAGPKASVPENRSRGPFAQFDGKIIRFDAEELF